MANSENESVWEVLGEARLGATCDMPFAYRVGLPDEPEIIDVSTKKIIKPRAIRIKNVTLTELLDRIEAGMKPVLEFQNGYGRFSPRMWFIAGRGEGVVFTYSGADVPVQHKELGEFQKARYALLIGERVILED